MSELSYFLALLAMRAYFHSRMGYVLDAILLASGTWLFVAAEHGPRLQLAWAWWPTYPLLAIVAFTGSVWMTTSEPRTYLRQLGAAAAAQGRRDHRRALRKALTAAGYEEVVWRVVAQSALASLMPGPLAIVAVSISFTFLHRSRTRGNVPQIAELLSFSLLLGYLFSTWCDPILIVTLHATRNYLIEIGRVQHEQA
jgi:hypothetical protein